ncbi:MAG TPA: GyrI-like domain-containing protein [Cytophagaceae bacterium]|nr:GyrI-like domain-containing protein [Cytophagaceae bacterium]
MNIVQPRFETFPETTLTGIRMAMSLVENKTGILWKNFMMQRNNISNSLGTDLFSIQRYSPSYFSDFNPSHPFEKWAAVEISAAARTPEGMETIIIPKGLYAVFFYKGLSTDPSIFQYIFSSWLPQSGYVLDDRPHFEKLGEKYQNNHPDSEEEIWIPVRKR